MTMGINVYVITIGCLGVLTLFVSCKSLPLEKRKLVKRNVDHVIDVILDGNARQPELQRVKREEPGLQRVKRGEPELYRVKRRDPELQRVKRSSPDLEEELTRVKRREIPEPALQRVKRNEIAQRHVKVEDEPELQRYKRNKRDVIKTKDAEEELKRYKRDRRDLAGDAEDDSLHHINGRPLGERVKRVLANKNNHRRSFVRRLLMRRRKRHRQLRENGNKGLNHVVKRVLNDNRNNRNVENRNSKKNKKRADQGKMLPREKKDGHLIHQRVHQEKMKRNLQKLNRLRREIKSKIKKQ